jgi:CheY-like chemotaxis protein
VGLESQVRERSRVAEERSRQLLALAVQLADVEERERDRLAGVLHEDLQQTLASACYILQSLEHAVSEKPADHQDVKALFLRAAEVLQESLGQARNLAYELSPPVLHQGGLLPAAEWLARRLRVQHGLETTILTEGWQEFDGRPARSLLYHALREVLFNVIKHSGARSAEVRLVRTAETVGVMVSDQGWGFDTAALGKPDAHGFGLLAVRERIQAMGGDFSVESSPGEGTRVILGLPVESVHSQGDQPPAEASVERAPAAAFRVVFADDHQVIRRGLVAMVRGQPNLQVVGEASDGHEAVEMARALRPDVVVMDVTMPGVDGIEATRQIKAADPAIRVVGLSMSEDQETAEAMRAAGAEAFLSKTASAKEMLRAIYGIDSEVTPPKDPPPGG